MAPHPTRDPPLTRGLTAGPAEGSQREAEDNAKLEVPDAPPPPAAESARPEDAVAVSLSAKPELPEYPMGRSSSARPEDAMVACMSGRPDSGVGRASLSTSPEAFMTASQSGRPESLIGRSMSTKPETAMGRSMSTRSGAAAVGRSVSGKPEAAVGRSVSYKAEALGQNSLALSDFGSQVERVATTASHGTSSKALMSKIEAFDNLREDERKRMFHALVLLFKCMKGLGGTITATGILVGQLLEEPYIIKGAYALGACFFSWGLVIGSACPPDLLDVNEIMRKNWKTRVAFALLAFALGPLMQAADNFPHLELLLVLIGVAAAFSGWRRLPSWYPFTTTCISMWILVYPVCWGGIYLFPQEHQEYRPISLVVAAIYIFMAIYMAWMWRRRTRSAKGADSVHGMAMYEVMYACLMTEGVADGVNGVTKIALFDPVEGAFQVLRCMCILTPTIAVLMIGRYRLFNMLGRRLDRDGKRLRRDGAFIAELLDTVAVHVGQVWWVHRENEDERYQEFDPRRRWQQGLVTEVAPETNDFVVQLQRHEVDGAQIAMEALPTNFAATLMGGPTVRMKMSSSGSKTKEDLLLQAQQGLRCVDFEKLTPELMKRTNAKNNPELQAHWNSLARPLKPGEKISYFMSNSWYDNPETKWKKLCEVAEKYKARNGRYPTFWLDKLCIEQTAITDGLKVLPVNVMACDKLLALCGDTYLARLWCIWELFTLFAFVSEAAAMERIEFVFLGDYEDGMDMLDDMKDFHVRDSHCYDPNEEARLREVIDAVGTARFNKRIANLAALTRARVEQKHMKVSKQRSSGGMSKTFSLMSAKKSNASGSTIDLESLAV